jgi:hypothetical protein
MVWGASDEAADIHVEADNYRDQQIRLWINNIV